jgi:serine/threonine protein kinase
MAGAACYFAYERRKRRFADGLKQPLMQNQQDNTSTQRSMEMHHSGDVDNTGGDSGGQVPGEPVEPAEYDEDTGAPINMTAKKDVAHEWNSAALTGERGRVVDLPYEELEGATHAFSEFNQVGGGASCTVFRCFLFGITVAVKQLKNTAVEWEAKQFAAEMELLVSASHPHICRLLAFSHDGPHRCLVLELCSGGALNERLACKAAPGRAPPAPLTCQERVCIAYGIVSALEYLHGLTPQMIHRCVVYKSRSIGLSPMMCCLCFFSQRPQDTERAAG